MTSAFIGIVGLLLTSSSLVAQENPQELARYIERRKACEHFRQEPWPEGSSVEEEERRKFITGQLERYCKDADPTLRALKNKYKNNRALTDRLELYEADIEGQP